MLSKYKSVANIESLSLLSLYGKFPIQLSRSHCLCISATLRDYDKKILLNIRNTRLFLLSCVKSLGIIYHCCKTKNNSN